MRLNHPDPFIIDGSDIRTREVRDYSGIKNQGDELLPAGKEARSLKIGFPSKKTVYYLLIISLGFLIILGRLVGLQFARGAQYQNIAEGNRIRIQIEKANRGVIYDRQNKPLVQNIPDFSLEVIPGDLPKDKEIFDQLVLKIAKILDEPAEELQKTFLALPKKSFELVTIKESLDYQKALALKIESSQLPGIIVETSSRRQYLLGKAFSNILGYLGKMNKDEFEKYRTEPQNYSLNDYLGRTGLEFSYETVLKGINGRRQVEVDSLGKEDKIIAEENSIPGDNLVTTINSDLQNIIQDALDQSVKSSGGTGGAAVAIDPRNGEVLALVSSPIFDNNLFARGLSQSEYEKLISDPKNPLFNRPVSAEYPSGSTIKPVIAAAGLQEKVITPATVINSAGGIKIDKWFFPDWKAAGHGLTNLTKALAESVNTFFYTVAGGNGDFQGLGIDRIQKYASLFGLSQKTGIDLPGERSGFIPSKDWKEKVKKEPWYIGDTYHLGIGQGDLLVTPLQVTNYMAAIANGGTLFKPHLVKAFTNPENQLVEEISPEIIRSNLIDSKYLSEIKKGLREAVVSGSAQAIGNLNVQAAAKTGTAQFGNQNKSHAWFTALAPYQNPEIVITVIIEGGGEGHAAALPVAKKALEWYFSK